MAPPVMQILYLDFFLILFFLLLFYSSLFLCLPAYSSGCFTFDYI